MNLVLNDKILSDFSSVYNLFFNCQMELANNHSPV